MDPCVGLEVRGVGGVRLLERGHSAPNRPWCWSRRRVVALPRHELSESILQPLGPLAREVREPAVNLGDRELYCVEGSMVVHRANESSGDLRFRLEVRVHRVEPGSVLHFVQWNDARALDLGPAVTIPTPNFEVIQAGTGT